MNEKFFYKTIPWVHQVEISKIKGSRFFATSFFIQNQQEAENYIKKMQKKYHDATHNCYAYRCWTKVNFDLFWNLEVTPERIKFSDDGEPINTAGKPILSVIQWNNLHNILVVVTRYFWWTLLGVWWLIQAYTNTTKLLVEKIKISELEINDTLILSFDIKDYSNLMKLLENYPTIKIKNQNFLDSVGDMTIILNKAIIEKFKKSIGLLWIKIL